MFIHRAKAVVRGARHFVWLAWAVLTGCLAGNPQAGEAARHAATPETGRLQVPGSYMTSRTCGSEWGDLVVLTLRSDGMFSLRQTYRDEDCGRPVTLVYLGHWSLGNGGGELHLDNGPVWLRRLPILNHRTLRIPDHPASEPPSRAVVHTAIRTPLLPFRDPFHLRGLGTFSGWPD